MQDHNGVKPGLARCHISVNRCAFHFNTRSAARQLTPIYQKNSLSIIFQHAILPGANPTKPVEFEFQSDARLAARSEKEKAKASTCSKKPHNPVPVPDFKALHAAQEAEHALRRDQIVPVVSLPVELSTEGRAKEREKFNAMMREKEREIERALEQRRREQEEEEEKLVRELRKKAVPRAHEVPGWYKEAPRRTAECEGSVGV